MYRSLFVILLLCSCSALADTDNICQVLEQHPTWYSAAQASKQRWGVPVHVQMAIMHRESNFKAQAKNPHSTAYGYAQVINATWREFESKLGQPRKRDNFHHASEFIGWYGKQMQQSLGINPNNAADLYIAYHDGSGGYKRAKRNQKSVAAKLARHVAADALRYRNQLAGCRPKCLTPEQHYDVWRSHPYIKALSSYTSR